jgi:hypothetical protein
MPTARDTKSASAPPSRSARIVRVSFVGHHLVQCKPDQDLIYSHRPAGSRGHAAGPEAVNRAVPRQERGRRDARLLPSPERLRGSTPASGPRGAHSTAWRMHGLPLSIHPVWLQTPRSGCTTETAIKAAMIAPRRLRSSPRWVTLLGVLDTEEPKGSMKKVSGLSANCPCRRSNRHRADAGTAGPWGCFTANLRAQ